ncbi:hypothetical protein NPIL_61571 [Nephila pilipes]|uniref:Uncharacterized protein n=1 Tax=Nephila pilipes TaxID=299642 RepID=A0A8X6MNP1_NEPPI|nr:hypothetical protein NPIL_61571 [Nephila pilipes]
MIAVHQPLPAFQFWIPPGLFRIIFFSGKTVINWIQSGSIYVYGFLVLGVASSLCSIALTPEFNFLRSQLSLSDLFCSFVLDAQNNHDRKKSSLHFPTVLCWTLEFEIHWSQCSYPNFSVAFGRTRHFHSDWYISDHGRELAAVVVPMEKKIRSLIALRIRRVVGLMHVKLVEVPSPAVRVV